MGCSVFSDERKIDSDFWSLIGFFICLFLKLNQFFFEFCYRYRYLSGNTDFRCDQESTRFLLKKRTYFIYFQILHGWTTSEACYPSSTYPRSLVLNQTVHKNVPQFAFDEGIVMFVAFDFISFFFFFVYEKIKKKIQYLSNCMRITVKPTINICNPEIFEPTIQSKLAYLLHLKLMNLILFPLLLWFIF